MAECVAGDAASTVEDAAGAGSSDAYDSVALTFRITNEVESPEDLVLADVGFRDEGSFLALLEKELLLALSSKRAAKY
ncbi:unnamed protein product [Schistocephalus solidus]|uniref:Transposase n=1 Tax=Schistocephalus solidus TaxID=70667 RepID=A0A183T7U7_SCHSO|nr:unnamed protein product [Schistocephalus solidus]